MKDNDRRANSIRLIMPDTSIMADRCLQVMRVDDTLEHVMRARSPCVGMRTDDNINGFTRGVARRCNQEISVRVPFILCYIRDIIDSIDTQD